MKALYAIVPFAPLLAAVLVGFFRQTFGRVGAHTVSILGVAISFVASMVIFFQLPENTVIDVNLYEWMRIGDLSVSIGFRIDALTSIMMMIVTFISLMVHIYTIGYMVDDPGYQRFFSYISLFTFAMLMLVMANNLLQLFFGWEAVGLVSYLLIGFWYTRESAIFANLKAFLVNRVGDLGFLLGIGMIVWLTGALHYDEIFQKISTLPPQVFELWGWSIPVFDMIGILLFIGAMGKSAQVPLHVWLPDSMEGPTPISALIHAATMVTAGIFMVVRMSPIFELAPMALTMMMTIGAITALFMGLVGMVQNDIKRVIAYSTLSQLGYMTTALGASAYSIAIFHLTTHAFFKALLFLAAGAVIIALHHQQDMRKMGGLRRVMPITFWTSLIGTLALIGTPGFSGFYSKDLIIEAVHASSRAVSPLAYWALTLGVFVTSFYSFRLLFMTFFGKPRYNTHELSHEHQSEVIQKEAYEKEQQVHEPHKVVTTPLVLLAIPSLLIGGMLIDTWIFGDFWGQAIYVDTSHHPVIETLAENYHGMLSMTLHALVTLPFWMALAGFITAWLFYIRYPCVPALLAKKLSLLYRLLLNKYYIDEFNQTVWIRGTQAVGRLLWNIGDRCVIDGSINGFAQLMHKIGLSLRRLQTGALSQYTLTILLGLILFILFLMFR